MITGIYLFSTFCYSLEEEFSNGISLLPTNSYDDLHLASLSKRSFQLGISPLSVNSYDDLHLASLWKRSFQLESLLFL